MKYNSRTFLNANFFAFVKVFELSDLNPWRRSWCVLGIAEIVMKIDDYIAVLAGQEAGEHLEYDAEFLLLVDAVAKKEESQYGDYVHIPEPIDWVAVEVKCKSLFQRTLDLRVAVYLTRVYLEREGLVGFANGLVLLRFLLGERWEEVHPRLSHEDQHDPLVRLNILEELSVSSVMVASLRQEILVKLLNGECLRCADLDAIANIRESAERDECRIRLESLIEPQCSTDLMRGLSTLNRIKGLLDSINQMLDEKTGLSNVSPLHSLSKLLHQWINVVDSRLRRTVQAVSLEAEADISRSAAVIAVSGGEARACRSREDVVIALDAVEAYYRLHEPSSPIPILIQRVRRLAGKDFLEIMAELAPTSVSDIRTLVGIQEG